jgi:hypothetical protein
MCAAASALKVDARLHCRHVRPPARWLGLVVLLALASPAAASAHLRTGVVAVDYRARVLPLRPALRAAAVVRVYESDQALGVTGRRGHAVVVLGYTGEPFLRINDAGVAVNASSPTAAAAGLLGRTRRSAGAGHGWHLLPGRRMAIWHDARVRWLPPGVRRGRWSLPLVVDGRRVRLEGEIWRVPAPTPWPWLALGLPFVVLSAVVLARKRSLRRPAAGCVRCVAAPGTVATATAFALSSSASAGRWVEGANELAFVLVGLAVVARGSSDARSITGGALGLLALWAGLSKVPVFLHGVVVSALPATLARGSVALTISAAVAATAVGLAVFFDLLEPEHESTLPGGQLGRHSQVRRSGRSGRA